MLILIRRLESMLASVYRANNRALYKFLTHLGQGVLYQRAPLPNNTTSTVVSVIVKSRKRPWFFT